MSYPKYYFKIRIQIQDQDHFPNYCYQNIEDLNPNRYRLRGFKTGLEYI